MFSTEKWILLCIVLYLLGFASGMAKALLVAKSMMPWLFCEGSL